MQGLHQVYKLQNIYGVDLDPQAVEIARLNLLLRGLGRRELLPTLADNVKRGNSLISGGEEELKRYFGEGWRDKRPFDWEQEFSKIMADGGFDLVIGNTPYVRIQRLPRDETDYYREHFTSARGSFDIYVMFIEQGLRLLQPGGRLGLITSGKFLQTDYGQSLRKFIQTEGTVEHIIDLSQHQVFAEATTYPVIIVLQKGFEDRPFRYVLVPSLPISEAAVPELDTISSLAASQSSMVKGVWPPRGEKISDKTKFTKGSNEYDLLEKLTQGTNTLLELPAMMSRGSSTGADDVFCLEGFEGSLRTVTGNSIDIESEILRSPLFATDFSRFYFDRRNEQRIIFPYLITDQSYEILPEQTLRERFPKTYRYLYAHKAKLQKRKQHRHWYGFSAPRNLNAHDQANFLVPLLADYGRCAPMPSKASQFCVMASAGFSVSLRTSEKYPNPSYVLGLVNSKLLFWGLYTSCRPT